MRTGNGEPSNDRQGVGGGRPPGEWSRDTVTTIELMEKECLEQGFQALITI
jgi:hypothetical protein